MKATAGELIREARLRIHMSQADLAQRAGIAQADLKAYESDLEDPEFRTFIKLIEAARHQLDLIPPSQDENDQLELSLRQRLEKHRDAIISISAQRGASVSRSDAQRLDYLRL